MVKEHSKRSMHDTSTPGLINTSVQQGLPDLLGGNLAVVTASLRVKRYSKKTTHDENQGGPKNTSRQAFANDAFANTNGESSLDFTFSEPVPNGQTPCRGKAFASKRRTNEGYRRAAKRAKQLQVSAEDPIQAISRLRELSASTNAAFMRPLSRTLLEIGQKAGHPPQKGLLLL